MAFTSMQEQLLYTKPLPIVLVLLAIPLYLIIQHKKNKNPYIPTEWPLVGMLPGMIANRHHFHDFAAAMLVASGHNVEVRGPPASSMRFFTTSDPENVRHIFTTNFDNYPKGEDFNELFSALAGTIIAVDSDEWRRQRTRIHYVLTRPEMVSSMEQSCRDKVADCLVPMLERMVNKGTPFDMDDLLGRIVMDLTVMNVFGMDPCLLSPDMPPMRLTGALDTLMQVALFRQCMPAFCWKLMKRLNVGHERRYADAESLLRAFTEERIARRIAGDDEPTGVDMLSYYIDDPEYRDDVTGEPTDFFTRTFVNFMVALRDPMSSALPWLVYNLAMHPRAVSALREELVPVAARKSSEPIVFEPQDTKHLVYQRAALFESLRLYPMSPIERKQVVADDVLPSGHALRAGETVLVSVYGMGRLEDVWGKDYREYRPERWITDNGDGSCKLRHVPSYKFMPFNTGPRSCLGKKVAVATITPVVATLFWNFDVEVMDSRAVEPKLSIIMQMKNGFMVKLKKRVHQI
uniref:Cytochrome P450 n=1 Tax=Leersia perrieri TaxID=77586 RepID=A0A0D9X5Z6_9ORYZ